MTESDLLLKYRQTHHQKFISEIFSNYSHLIFLVCLKYLGNREEAKDAVMDIYETTVEKLKTHEVHNFKSWIYSLSKNHCLMKLRQSKKIFSLDDENSFTFVESEDFLHQLDKEQIEKRNEIIENAIASLNSEQQKCIRLFYFEKKSYKEIALAIKEDVSKVKSYLQNGKRNLKLILEEILDNDE